MEAFFPGKHFFGEHFFGGSILMESIFSWGAFWWRAFFPREHFLGEHFFSGSILMESILTGSIFSGEHFVLGSIFWRAFFGEHFFGEHLGLHRLNHLEPGCCGASCSRLHPKQPASQQLGRLRSFNQSIKSKSNCDQGIFLIFGSIFLTYNTIYLYLSAEIFQA